MAKLNHPNIVNVHDFGQAGEFYYFVMEFVDGPNLRQTLLAQRLAPKEALGIVPAICDALQYAHDEGIVHRDIKPENIFISGTSTVLADFGIAKVMDLDGKRPSGPTRTPTDAHITRPGMTVGTPAYMAPEQLAGDAATDHRADLYSTGVVAFEMLAGRLPWDGR